MSSLPPQATQALKQGYELEVQADIFFSYCTELWEPSLEALLEQTTTLEAYLWLSQLAAQARSSHLDTRSFLGRLKPRDLAAVPAQPEVSLRAAQVLIPRAINFDFLELIAASAQHGIAFVTPDSPQWPARLNHLESMPRALWYRGDISVLNESKHVLGIVGSRCSTSQGIESAALVSEQAATGGALIVSGGAIGIDTVTHRSALAARGRTVAVLAHGLDRLYPASNQSLFQNILTGGGALISAHPVFMPPTRWRFLNRNRLLAALTEGIVVVQASCRSGSLNTASHAADLGLPVGAVPGPIVNSNWLGSNKLLKEGATPITSGADALQMLSPLGEISNCDPPTPTSFFDNMPSEAKRVLDALSPKKYKDADSLITETNLSGSQVLKALGLLEINGKIKARNGKWIRNQP